MDGVALAHWPLLDLSRSYVEVPYCCDKEHHELHCDSAWRKLGRGLKPLRTQIASKTLGSRQWTAGGSALGALCCGRDVLPPQAVVPLLLKTYLRVVFWKAFGLVPL